MRKQLDARWKQIDKFETSLKGLAEAKAGWRKKLVTREGEVEALKVDRLLSLAWLLSHPVRAFSRPMRSSRL